MKKPLSFPEFDVEFTYIPGFDPSDELSYQLKITSTTKKDSEQMVLSHVQRNFQMNFCMNLQLNFLKKKNRKI